MAAASQICHSRRHRIRYAGAVQGSHGNREPRFLQIHLPGRNDYGRAALVDSATGNERSDRGTFLPKVGHSLHHSIREYGHLPVLLQGHVPFGRLLRAIQQNRLVQAELFRGKLQPLRRMCEDLQNGDRSFPSAEQPGVYTMRRLRQSVPVFGPEGGDFQIIQRVPGRHFELPGYSTEGHPIGVTHEGIGRICAL